MPAGISGSTTPYKPAFALAAPQAALVVDLALRGEHGVLTMAAGITLLAATWGAVACLHARFGTARET